jgi:hypothetical protein
MKKFIVTCIIAFYLVFYGLVYSIQWILTLI